MIAIIYAPYWIVMGIFAGVVIIALLFIYLYGCCLTVAEYKLCRQDITIADPLIMIFGDDITKNSRINYSLAFMSSYFIISLCVIASRFWI